MPRDTQRIISAPVLINLVGFQLGWWLCVVHGESFWIAVPLLWVLLQPIFLKHTFNSLADARKGYSYSLRAEYALVGFAVVLGGLVEYGLAWANIWALPQAATVPVWLLVLWALLAGCIYHSFAWLMQRYLLAGVLAACFAPVSYITGAALNQHYELAAGWRPILLICATWVVVFPMLLYLAFGLARWGQPVNRAIGSGYESR